MLLLLYTSRLIGAVLDLQSTNNSLRRRGRTEWDDGIQLHGKEWGFNVAMIENSASKVPYCTKGGKVPDGGKEQSGMAKLDLHMLNKIKLVLKFKLLELHFCTWM